MSFNADGCYGSYPESGRKGTFQIIFMDPPYNQELEKDVLMLLSKSTLVDEDTVIIVEASLKTGFEYLEELGFTLDKCKNIRQIYMPLYPERNNL